MASANLDLLQMLTTKMSYDGARQKVLAQNIASLDTPGYKAQDLMPLDFKDVLASENHHITLAGTSPMHMTGKGGMSAHFQSVTQANTYERTPTGSTVVVEEQMMKVAQNATDYQMVTNLYQKIGTMFKEAIGQTT